MKDLNEIIVTEAKLKLIIGEQINYPFPILKKVGKDGKIRFRNESLSLQEIINTSDWAKKRSFDERFDQKHPIQLAVDSIREKGLSKNIRYQIFNDAKNIEKEKLVGKWAVLADVITDTEHKAIIDRLKQEAALVSERKRMAHAM